MSTPATTTKPTIEELEHILGSTNADEYETIIKPNGEIESIHHGREWALEKKVRELEGRIISMAKQFTAIRSSLDLCRATLPEKTWTDAVIKQGTPP